MKAGIRHAVGSIINSVEMNSLEELINFQKECGYDLIIEADSVYDKEKKFDFVITIYDNYIE